MGDNVVTEGECDRCVRRTNERHEELKSWVRGLSSEIKELRECISSKVNKLYLLVIAALGSTLLAFVTAILREAFRGR